jgi:hypothetical protein
MRCLFIEVSVPPGTVSVGTGVRRDLSVAFRVGEDVGVVSAGWVFKIRSPLRLGPLSNAKPFTKPHRHRRMHAMRGYFRLISQSDTFIRADKNSHNSP